MTGPGDLAAELREETGALTRQPPTGYTSARDGRVKALKADGRTDLAKALAKQRRPTLPAWAVDQLAHHHPDRLDELLRAATRLRTAQSSGSPDRDEVRAASAAFTGAVRELRSLAEERLRGTDTSPEPHLDEIEATLLAAATDPDVAADVRAGALLRPAPSPGFAAFAGPPAVPADGSSAGGGGHETAADADDETAADADDARLAAEAEAARAARRDELASRRRALEGQRDRVADRRDEARRERDAAREEAAALRARADEIEAGARDHDERRHALEGEVAAVDAELAAVDVELEDLDRETSVS